MRGTNVNATTPDTPEADWDRYEEELGGELPGRPRRQFLNRWTALLFAALVGAGCFYAGVRIEKSQLASASSGASLAGSFASRFGAAAGGTGTTSASGRSGAGSTSGSGAASGFAGRFGGGLATGGFAGATGAGGGAAAVGTVS